MWRDMERYCARYTIPLCRPSLFPRNGLGAARVACLASAAAWCPQFVRAVYHANFAEDRDTSDAATLITILDALGQPGAEHIER